MSQESGKVPSGTELMHQFCDRTIGEVMNDLRRENAALKAELERAKKDAIFWLRKARKYHYFADHKYDRINSIHPFCPHCNELDAAQRDEAKE